MDIIILIYVYKLKKIMIYFETVFNIYIISTLFACGYGICIIPLMIGGLPV